MQSAPPPPPIGPYSWPQPPLPPRKGVAPILVIVLVVVLLIGLLFAAFVVYFFLPLQRTPVALVPSVTLGPVGFSSGNATLDVISVTRAAPVGFFHVNLVVDSVTGTGQRIELDPRYATVPVSSQRYRVYFIDVGGNLTLGAGDRFVITGNGTSLPTSTSFTFYLLWILDGRMVGSMNWTQPKPLITFSSVTLSSGNATTSVAGASQAVSPSNYKLALKVGANTGTPIAMPVVNGGFVTLAIGGAVYRIYWTDIGREGTLDPGDILRITGNNTALPATTSFTFYLLWIDSTSIQAASWSTP